MDCGVEMSEAAALQFSFFSRHAGLKEALFGSSCAPKGDDNMHTESEMTAAQSLLLIQAGCALCFRFAPPAPTSLAWSGYSQSQQLR